VPANQASTELAEHREIEACVIQFQTQQVLPIESGANGLGRLPIGQPLRELQDAD